MFPQMVRVKQNYNHLNILNTKEVIKNAISNYMNIFKIEDIEGKKIGITVGSRGINNIVSIIKTISEFIISKGGITYLIPSMGSHGSGIIDGQLAILKSLGITEKSTASKIINNIDSLLLGNSQFGIPVFVNKNVLDLDGIVVVNRVKPHTDFEGSIESGICKMLAIGLGGPKGAYTVHSYALHKGYEQTIIDVAKTMVDKLNIIFMVGLIENRKGQLAKAQVINPKEIFVEEPKLLALSKKMHAKLPVDKLDVLIIDEIGKDISGTGMDTKIVGRIMVKGQKEPEKPTISRIVVLDITDKSHGNAIGLGLADIITRRVFNKIDLNTTAFNSVGSMSPEQGRIPVVMDSDKSAVNAALDSLGAIKHEESRIIHIRNTLFMEEMEVSLPLLKELSSRDSIRILGTSHPLNFSSKGFLPRI